MPRSRSRSRERPNNHVCGPIMYVSDCEDEARSKIIRGFYGISNMTNHGKPVYMKKMVPNKAKDIDVFIYYWDMRDGASWNGWWFGKRVGDIGVYAYAHNPRPHVFPRLPPTANWKLGDSIDRKLTITIQGLPDDGTAEQSLLEHVQALEQVLETERVKREAAEKQQEILEDKLRVLVEQLEESCVGFSCVYFLAQDEAVVFVTQYLVKSQGDYHRLGSALASEQQKLQEAQKRLEHMQRLMEEQKRIISSGHGAQWQYQENGGWHAMSLEANIQLTQAYMLYLREQPVAASVATINVAGVERRIDFKSMQQTRSDTNRVRKIRILLGVPEQWESTPDSLLLQSHRVASLYVEVTNARIHDKVLEILQSTGHARDMKQTCCYMQTARIKSAHRIENWRLWQGYKARCSALRQEHASHNVSVTPAALDLDAFEKGSDVMTSGQKILDCGEELAPDIDEKILLHGTSWDNVNSIVLNGFDHRTCQRSFYGDGVYFASAACKSHQYTCQMHKAGCYCAHERTLIIARVALGDAYRAKEVMKGLRRPPLRDSRIGVTYDSIVVEPGPIRGHHQTEQIHQEFVIFEREQAYPCFVVQYELCPYDEV